MPKNSCGSPRNGIRAFLANIDYNNNAHMKNFISIGIFLLASLCCQAQLTKDSLVRRIALDACDEISKKDLAGASQDAVMEMLGMALLPAMVKYEKELKEFYQLDDFSDAAAMEKVGRDVGMKLVFLCPEFARVITTGLASNSEGDDKNPRVLSMSEQTLSGTLLKIETGEFTSLQIRTPAGKMEKIWWFEYFSGADILLENPAKLVGKKVVVNYVEKERFTHATKEYARIKLATGIKLSN